jgi:hypothetical protein
MAFKNSLLSTSASGENLRPSILLSKLREAMFLSPHDFESGHEVDQVCCNLSLKVVQRADSSLIV